MKEEHKTKEQLINESAEMRQRIAELEASEAEHKQVEETLRESEEHYRSMEEALAQERNLLRALMDTVPDHIYFKDTDSRFIRVSKALAEWFGLSDPAQAVGKADFDFFTEEHARPAYEDEQRIVRTGQPLVGIEERETWPDRPDTWVLTSKMPLRDEGGKIVGTFGISRDITSRKRAEEKIEHLNLVLSAIRNVNQLITRERDRNRLLQGACETLIATRGYHSAWIVLLDESGGVMTTAEAGLGEDFLPLVERLKRGELTDCVQRAMKHSGGVVTEDPSSTCVDCPLSSMYDGRGAVTIQLGYSGKVYGLLSVSIPRDLCADEEEQGLFEEVAGDIAFALHNMELEEEHRAADEALQQREAVLGAMALAAEKFLRPSDWEQNMQAALAYLGKAADVSRAIIWEVSTTDDGKYSISACYEWIASEAKLAPQVGLQNVRVFRRWRDLLPRGEIVAGHVRDFSAKEQEFFVPRGIKSVLVVPIFVNDAWWGFMGFDQGGIEREWTEAEIDTLKTAASILSGALDRKRAEEALAEERNLLRTVIDNLPDIIYAKDTESRFVIGNTAVARLMGATTPDELLGKTDFDFYPQELAKQYYADEQEIMRLGQPLINREEPLMNQVTGRKGWLSTTKVPLRDSLGRITGFVGIGKDITELKQAQEELKGYSERLEEMVEERTQELRDAQEQLVRREKLAVLGQMAGGVGHELRNPLGAISNAVYFLNMVLEEPDPEVKETLEILQKEVKTSEVIINSLLDFARAKPPTRRKVDINEVVEEALSRIAVPEEVEVVEQLDETLPIILADPDQLVQVFGNIILNAVQAMSEGGRLVVKSEIPTPEWVAVSFADTGVGISKEGLDKLFEPLFTTKAKGVGLGLAVTKTLVDGHGGTIEVESEMGVGTTFTVQLPISVS